MSETDNANKYLNCGLLHGKPCIKPEIGNCSACTVAETDLERRTKLYPNGIVFRTRPKGKDTLVLQQKINIWIFPWWINMAFVRDGMPGWVRTPDKSN